MDYFLGTLVGIYDPPLYKNKIVITSKIGCSVHHLKDLCSFVLAGCPFCELLNLEFTFNSISKLVNKICHFINLKYYIHNFFLNAKCNKVYDYDFREQENFI